MWENKENNDNTEPTVGEVVEPSYAELKLKFDEAERLREFHKDNAERHYRKLVELQNQVTEFQTYLRENWESLDAHAEELADLFGLEMTSTKTFTFTIDVEVEVTATSPAYNWSDFDGSELDFDVSASVSYNSRNDLDDATVESTDVRACEEA
jgi:hypothetical protein